MPLTCHINPAARLRLISSEVAPIAEGAGPSGYLPISNINARLFCDYYGIIGNYEQEEWERLGIPPGNNNGGISAYLPTSVAVKLLFALPSAEENQQTGVILPQIDTLMFLKTYSIDYTGYGVATKPGGHWIPKSKPIRDAATLNHSKSVGQVLDKADLPAETRLLNNYPNPFNPSTELRYQLASPGDVSLVVVDLLGREVAQLASGFHSPGDYAIRWMANDIASGIYFVRFSVRNNEGVKYYQTKRMTLVK